MKMGKKFILLGQDKSFDFFSKLSFVAVFGTFIEAFLSNSEVIFWGFGELFKMFKIFKNNSEKLTKIIKHGRNWVEVGPNETWIGQIDAEFYFLAIPHVKNSQK